MKYLVCQDWENTANNHAGMKHMSNLLKAKFPGDYKVYVFADSLGNKKRNLLGKIEWKIITKLINPLNNILLGISLCFKLKDNDEVFLLEYMERITPQIYIARILKLFRPKIKVMGLVHLTPQVLELSFGRAEIEKWTKPIDKVITMGSSLSNYFIDNGVPAAKVATIFHYVDTDYYTEPEVRKNAGENITVIAMGNQKRNYGILSNIVEANPGVSFTICKGVNNIDDIFSRYKNVTLVGFVSEDKLKELMQDADISLNVMDDTVGSNVITTSMATGLAMVVSDVGSIRDYCGGDGAIYCVNDDVNSFSSAIRTLNSDKAKLAELKQNSMKRSRSFSIEALNSTLQEL